MRNRLISIMTLLLFLCNSLPLAAELSGKELLSHLEQSYYESQATGDFTLQLKCVNAYLDEARHLKSAVDIQNALALRASLFYNNDMNDSIFSVIPNDLEELKSLKAWQVYYEVWAYIANTYIFTGQNNIALRETKAIYEDASDRNDKYGMGLAYGIMGTAYANLRNFDQSIEVFQKSLALLSSIKPSPSVLPETYTYFGNALNDMHDYTQLESLTQRWKPFLEQYVQEHNLAGTATESLYLSYYYLACAQAALGLEKLDQAEQMLKQAREHIASEESYRGCKWLYYMGQLYLQRHRYQDALDFNNRRMQLLEAGSDKTVTIMVWQQRAEIMKGLGRFHEAADLYRNVYLESDSANAQGTKNQLNEMNTMFQVNELEMEQERLKMEKERSQMHFIIVVVSIIVLSLGIFLFFRIRAARKLQQAHNQLQHAYNDLQAANEVIEQTTAAKERIESELRIARDIQAGMVPTTFPDRPDLDLFASMTPAKEVGGDLYDYLLIESNEETRADRLYFCLGDVSGKGVPASLFMSQATRLFRALAKQELMPADIATRLNAELTESNDSGMFVTMFIGLVDLKTGHLHFCNAGHNPPVLIEDAGCRFIDMEPNAPIGLWPGLDYEGEEIDTILGKPLFIYTDGLNEAENREQAQFGDDRLLEILQETPFESSRQTIGLLKEEVEKHRDGADPNDDLTMLCVKIINNN